MVLVAQSYTYSVPRMCAPQKLPELCHLNGSASPGLQGSGKAEAGSSPVFSFEDDPSGMPMKIQNRALAGRTSGAAPKAKRTLMPVASITPASSSSDQQSAVEQPEDAWALAKLRVEEREDRWHQLQAVERLQKHVRAWAARKRVAIMRKERDERLRAAEREVAAALERAERDRVAAQQAEAQRLQQESAAMEAARVVKQRRDEALQARVESQRQRRKQRLELNRAATAAARDALPPDASAREVSVSLQLIPHAPVSMANLSLVVMA
jgi:hypothetical protein